MYVYKRDIYKVSFRGFEDFITYPFRHYEFNSTQMTDMGRWLLDRNDIGYVEWHPNTATAIYATQEAYLDEEKLLAGLEDIHGEGNVEVYHKEKTRKIYP